MVRLEPGDVQAIGNVVRRPSSALEPVTDPLRHRDKPDGPLSSTPRDCIAHLQQFKASGCRRITFRISTMRDPMAQLRRVVEEVLPFV